VKAIDALLRDGRTRNRSGRLQDVALDEENKSLARK
jgi:hypothetical protein